MNVADLGGALSFEWTKLRTLRSAIWNLAVYAVVSLAVGLLAGVLVQGMYPRLSRSAQAAFDPVSTGFSGLRLGLVALVAFGVLVVTNEYSSGMMRASLAAVPRRGMLYGAKVLAVTVTAFIVSVFVVLTSFFATQLAMGAGLGVSLGDESVLRSLLGAVLYTTMLCTFSMGVASLLRSSALTLSLLLPLFFMVSTLLNDFEALRTVAQFLPDVAGGQILYRHQQPGTVLTPWTGLAVLLAWTVVSVLAGYVAMRRRDV
ncbi:MAG TPA: ABC transporter permease subunit [Kineosporiaceae bacterium]|nr:ABC transporter permease subunit [Kineosporiaceae bacterium]